MLRLIKLAIPAAVLAGGFLLSSQLSVAKPDYFKKEKKACTYCHVAPNKKGLNEVGKCYAEHGHTLDNCKPNKIGGAD